MQNRIFVKIVVPGANICYNESLKGGVHMAYVRFYEDLRLKEKRANERMRQLEKAKIKSPAYQAVQAKLEVLGKQTKGDRGRRFSETGKATYNEMEALEKILNNFLGYETSTLRGAKKYREDIWQTANNNNKLTSIILKLEIMLDK